MEIDEIFEEETLFEDTRLNDSVIEKVEMIEADLAVTLKTDEGESIVVLCREAEMESQIEPEGMVLFGVDQEEMEDGRLFVEFINWFDREDPKGKSALSLYCKEVVFK